MNEDLLSDVTKPDTQDADAEMSCSSIYHPLNRELYDEFEALRKEYRDDVKVNLVNLSDVAMRVPDIKAKWVSRLNLYSNQMKYVEKLIKIEVKKVSPQIQKEAPVKLTEANIEKIAKDGKYPRISALVERLELLGQMVENMRNVVDKHMKYFNSEVHDMIILHKMETT